MERFQSGVPPFFTGSFAYEAATHTVERKDRAILHDPGEKRSRWNGIATLTRIDRFHRNRLPPLDRLSDPR